jgi:predicted porin
LAYEDLSEEHVTLVHNAALDYDKWRLGLGYTANGFHVGFIYEDRDLETIGDGDSWQLSGSYTAGNNTFKIAYGQADDMVRDAGLGFQVDDAEQWTIGVDHKMSNRTKVYAAYSDYSEDTADRDWDAFSLGIVHTF